MDIPWFQKMLRSEESRGTVLQGNISKEPHQKHNKRAQKDPKKAKLKEKKTKKSEIDGHTWY